MESVSMISLLLCAQCMQLWHNVPQLILGQFPMDQSDHEIEVLVILIGQFESMDDKPGIYSSGHIQLTEHGSDTVSIESMLTYILIHCIPNHNYWCQLHVQLASYTYIEQEALPQENTCHTCVLEKSCVTALSRDYPIMPAYFYT